MIGFEPEFYLLDPDTNGLLFEGYHIFNTVRNTYVPFIQELVGHLNDDRARDHHGELRVRRLAMGGQLRSGHGHGWPRRCFHLQERGQGARAPERISRHLHVEAVRRLGRLRLPHAFQLARPESGENLFADESAEAGISDLCRQFVAGQLRHARSIYALLAPTVNCMKRRRTHTFSPTNVSWGFEDRSAFVRIKGGSVKSRHVENRAATGLSNPYLAGAAVLAAGLLGIEEQLELEPPARAPAEEDPSKPPLPESVRESLEALESDEKIVGLLGDEFVKAYGVMRRHELQRFDDQVTDWERDEYLEIY